jgi:ParB-like chromosome segregation protein Spo0J
MTIQWLQIESLCEHPDDSGLSKEDAGRLLFRIRQWVERTGLYAPLVVREASHNPMSDDFISGVYSHVLIDGNHRLRILRDLGHTHARCDVWDCAVETARLFREEAK